MLPLCYKSGFGVGRGPREGRGWGNSMLLMLGMVSSVMMLYDADMLLVRKSGLVWPGAGDFACVFWSVLESSPKATLAFSRKPYMRYDISILIFRGHGRGAAGS